MLSANREVIAGRGRELVEFSNGAWPLMDVLEMNWAGGFRDMLSFFQAESAVYPQIDALQRRRVRKACRPEMPKRRERRVHAGTCAHLTNR